MQRIILIAALATFVASPALSAQSKSKPIQVICNGQLVGQDTDLWVLFEMKRDCANTTVGGGN